MPQSIGPYDGRKARRKRCDRCVERRIKCIGGIPCLNCSKTNRACYTTTKSKTSTPVFVHATQATFINTGQFYGKETTTPVALEVSPSIRNDTYITYFFTSFLRQNTFTGVAPHLKTSLFSFVHDSPELLDAINAISAFHITQNCQSESTKPNDLAALKAYSRSVTRVQSKIASKTFIYDPSALWTTLLLGIFELMRDNTGTNWLAHFLHGTGTILRMQGYTFLTCPGKKNQELQSFFFTARIFEIVRALVFTEPTFLNDQQWKLAIEMYWAEHLDAWTPKEALFDILPQFVDLGIRTLSYIAKSQDMPQHAQHHFAKSLAQDGLILQSALLDWHAGFTYWTLFGGEVDKLDPETTITDVYYHTVSIYLDGIFSYHVPFTSATAPPSPTLDSAVIDEHVSQILTLSHQLLDQGSAGIFLFFPLRVAGARARSSSTKCEILQLLQTINQRGFSVAQSFTDDLNELWAGQ